MDNLHLEYKVQKATGIVFGERVMEKSRLAADIIEKISEQVHKTWMSNRIQEGWKYGPERNDSLKQTPCIVPYSELPELEKEYDRKTVITTINALYDLGFSITKE